MMAEDDDDESFGDFTFASASNPSIQFNQQQPLSQISGPNSTVVTAATDSGGQEAKDDDEWGDFVETSLGSAAPSGNLSKPFDPLNFFASNPPSQLQSQSEAANTTWVMAGLNESQSEKKATQSVKLKGAIPLSIFGDDEEEEEQVEEGRPGVNDPQDNNGKDSGSSVSSSNYYVNNASKGNAYLGVGMSYDTIAKLYNSNQQINLNNGLGSNINVSNMNTNGVDSSMQESILELSGVNLDLGSAAKERNSYIGMDFNNQSQKVKIQDVERSNGTTNSNLDGLNMDFTGWNIDLNGLNMKSDFDMIGNVNNQRQVSKVKSGSSQSNSNGLELDLTEKKSSNFVGWNFDFDGFRPDTNVMNLDFQVSSSNANGDPSDDDDDDDSGWEFKDAHSESKFSNGNEKIQSEELKALEAKTNSKEFEKDSNRTIDLFSLSSGSFDLFSASNGISGSSHNIAVGLDSKPSAAAQNGFGLDTFLKKEQTISNGGLESLVGNAESQQDFGEFAAAFEETGPRKKAEPRMHESAEMNSSSEFANFLNGSTDFFAGSMGSIDLFVPVNENSNDLNKVDIKVDSNPSTAPKVESAHNGYTLEANSRSEKTNDQGALDSRLVVGGAEVDDDFGEYTAASVESAQEPEGTGIRPENHKGALPLSIFGDEEPEIDASLDIQDAFLHQSGSYKRNDHSSNSTILINDLISKLYTQAEQISPVDSVHKPTQNGLTPSEAALSSSVAKDIDDFDDSSWEFKDAFSERAAENGTSLHNNGDADHSSYSTQLKLNHYVDFYSKLMDELHFLAKCHLESLREAQATAAACEDANLAILIEEIQQAYNESGPKNAISKEPSEDYVRRESDVSGLLKILQEPEFHILESEYSLRTKLPLVEKDSRSTIQLIKHAKTTLKILSLGSLEEQLTYVSIWSKMISVCAEELRYGAQIWGQSLEKNLQSQILTDLQGKRFLLALCEIYRVAIVLEASVKLYKPWTLLTSVESSSMYTLLDECHALWCSSGLEEALLSISDSTSLNGDNSASLLVDSIKYSHDLDALTLEKDVFTHQEPLCRLSLLTSSVVPGMAIVEWGGEQCFVKLANLWANLICNDIPKLPSLHVTC